MRVLIVTRPDDGHHGGDLYQARKTADTLRNLGFDVMISSEVMDGYDVYHFFVFITPLMYANLMEVSGRCVVSMIYRDPLYGE